MTFLKVFSRVCSRKIRLVLFLGLSTLLFFATWFTENYNWLWILYLFCLIFVIGKLFLHARAPNLQFLAEGFLSHSEFPTFSCPPMCHRHPMLQVAHSFQETHSSGFLQENLFVNEFTQEWLQPSKRTPKLSIFQNQHLPSYLQNSVLLCLSRSLCF